VTLLQDRAVTARSAPGRSSFWTMRRRDHLTGYLFITPALAGAVAFVFLPLVLVVWYSLHEWNVLADTFDFVGSENYRKLAEDPNVPAVLRATALFSIGLVVLNLGLALLLAVLLNQRLRGTTVFRVLFFSPVVVSLLAWTIVWGFLLQDNGGVNGMLGAIGVDGPNWLRSGGTAMASVIVVQVFKNVGLNMVLFLAALQGVPQELYEAARTDGAGPWTVFRRITLPLISPTILTQGGPGTSTTVLVYYLYQQAFQFHAFGYGSTLSVLLFLIVLALTVLQWQMRKRWVTYES
jgi:multiple sugar transport system permease protein